VRVAVVNEEATAAAAADLFTAQLSKTPGIVVLERRELGKIMAEQRLTTENQSVLSIGKIIGADGVFLFHFTREGTNETMGVRLAATGPGVIAGMVSTRWPPADAAGWAAGLARRFEPELSKLAVVPGQAIPLSVLNLRSALRTAESDETERELTALLLMRLSREPKIFLLERRDMQHLVTEHEFTPDESKFWTGRYLLEGTLDQTNFNQETITLNARLSSPDGSATNFVVSAPRRDLMALVESSIRPLLTALKQTSTSPGWVAKGEADRYSQEAQWALRWGQLREAQQASESAWALGNRTRILALTRLRSYSTTVTWDEPSVGNIVIPFWPRSEQIPIATRAARLFCEDFLIGSPDKSKPDPEWQDAGFSTLRRASAFLDGFYISAEARRGNEPELGELRSALRDLAQALRANKPTNAVTQTGRVVEFLVWEEAGTWFEKPEDALPLFKSIVHEGYHSRRLPRIAGWSWDDRKKAPAVTRRFLAELGAEKDVRCQMEGKYLSLIWLPYYDDGQFRAAEEELARLIYERRHAVWSSMEDFSIIPDALEVVKEKSGHLFDNAFHDELFDTLFVKLRIECLKSGTNVDYQAFTRLFPADAASYSQPAAAELLGFLKTFGSGDRPGSRSKILGAYISRVASALNTRASASAGNDGLPKGVPPAQSRKEAQAIKIPLTQWNLQTASKYPGTKALIGSGILREEKAWYSVYYRPDFGLGEELTTTFARISPESGVEEEIQFPQEHGVPARSFEVTADSLYATTQDRLHSYQFSTRRWKEIALPAHETTSLTRVGSNLFLSSREGLLMFDPRSSSVEVLVSSRRQPSIGIMDPIWSDQTFVFHTGGQKLGVFSTNERFVFDIGARAWARGPSLPILPGTYQVAPMSDEAGLTLLLGGVAHFYLVGIGHNSTNIEHLAERVAKPGWSRVNAIAKFGAPRWQWPAELPLEDSVLANDAAHCWVALSSTARNHFENRNNDSDPRRTLSSVVKMNYADKSVVINQVQFTQNQDPVNPFDAVFQDRRHSPFARKEIFLLNAKDTLILSCPAISGHWVVKKNLLKGELGQASPGFPEPAATGPLKTSTKERIR
jgi:hypothetical protein